MAAHAATYTEHYYSGTSFPSSVSWRCSCGKNGVISDGKHAPSRARAKAAFNIHKKAENAKTERPKAAEGSTALRYMQEQVVAGRNRGNLGYVTNVGELKKILNELSNHTSVGIVSTGVPSYGLLSYDIKVGFSLSPKHLDAAKKG
jgi:hypothetical protein